MTNHHDILRHITWLSRFHFTILTVQFSMLYTNPPYFLAQLYYTYKDFHCTTSKTIVGQWPRSTSFTSLVKCRFFQSFRVNSSPKGSPLSVLILTRFSFSSCQPRQHNQYQQLPAIFQGILHSSLFVSYLQYKGQDMITDRYKAFM